MSYFCQQCGECCSVMGQVFSIVEKMGEWRYLFRNEYSGDTVPVEVAPHMRDFFLSNSIPPGSLNPCPFVRWDTDRRMAFCTVHQTRPDICREYQCWRILFLDPDGRRIARVMGEQYLCLDDESLRASWDEFRESLDCLSSAEWDERVIRFFKEQGYTIIV